MKVKILQLECGCTIARAGDTEEDIANILKHVLVCDKARELVVKNCTPVPKLDPSGSSESAD